MISEPFAFTVAPVTRFPAFFSTGIGSPEIIDSSMLLTPSRTTPSTGTFSPVGHRVHKIPAGITNHVERGE
jgi:hypothetical protein